MLLDAGRGAIRGTLRGRQAPPSGSDCLDECHSACQVEFEQVVDRALGGTFKRWAVRRTVRELQAAIEAGHSWPPAMSCLLLDTKTDAAGKLDQAGSV